ncbi:Arc family DNA-binding protein [Acrocarpospora sp. B8E8]
MGTIAFMELRLRLPDEIHARLRVVADEDGNSLNSEIVIAIEEHLARRQESAVRAIARKVAQRDAELLHRLSQ